MASQCSAASDSKPLVHVEGGSQGSYPGEDELTAWGRVDGVGRFS